MKKKRFLFSLLMAIVMMAMSPQKMWATADVTWSLGGAYEDDPASGVWVGSSEGGGEQIKSGHLYLCFTPAGTDSQLNNWITQLTSLSSNSGLDGACVDAMNEFLAANSQWSGYNADNANFSANCFRQTGGAFGTPISIGQESASPVTIDGIDQNKAYDVVAIIFDTQEITADSKYVVIKGYGKQDFYAQSYTGLLEIGFASEWNDGDIDPGNAAPNNAVDGQWHSIGAAHTLTAHPAAAATCTTAGYSSDCWSCSACGKYFSDAEGKNVIAASSVVIPATGHTLTEHPAVDATLASNGNNAYWSCSVCGKYFSDAEGKNEIAENSWVIAKTTNISLGTRYIDGKLYYEIGNSADLCAFSDLVSARSSDKSFHMNLNAILTADIEFDNSRYFNPIGITGTDCSSYPQSYTGTFDGDGHTIRSLNMTYIRRYGTAYCGFFCFLNGATVKNLNITNLNWTSNNQDNGFLANDITGSTLSNVYIEGTLNVYYFETHFGVFATNMYGTTTFTNCGVNAVLAQSSQRNSYSNACGFFYSVSSGATVTLNNCYFGGSFTGINADNADYSSGSYRHAYPFYRYQNGTANFNNCYAVTYQGEYLTDYTARNTDAGITYKAPSAFTSGEVAYLLNGSQDAGTWRQKLSGEGVNTSPVLKQTDDNKVYYGYANCAATEKTYANSALHATQEHSFTNYTYNNDVTCTKNGTKTASCDNGCGATDTKDDPEHLAKGHEFNNTTDPHHTFCTVCNHGFFRYTASERVTPKTISNLKNASGQGIYVDSQNTWDADTKEGVMEFNEPLAIIGDKAFEQCAFTGNLVIPNSVKSIGNNAFYKCGNLTNVEFNSVPLVGSHVFDDCDEEIYYDLILTDDSYVYTGNETNNFPAADIWAVYKRTNIKNKWGTLVVPFDVLADQEEYDLYSIISVDDEELTLERPEGTLAAGTPVLIRMSEAGKDAETGKYNLFLDAANETLKTSGTLTSEIVEGLTLKGSYDVKDITEVSGYIISNNAFWNIQTIKGENRVYNAPFRAYLEGSTANCAAQLRIGTDDDEDITAVETLDALTSDEAQYYDINGCKLNDLQQGINIVKRGNKTYKVIIK